MTLHLPEEVTLSVALVDEDKGLAAEAQAERLDPSAWSPGTGQEGEVIRHGGMSYAIDEETLLDASADENEYRTSAGSDEVAGTWEIEIPDLWYHSGDGQDVHLEGPWTLEVTVP